MNKDAGNAPKLHTTNANTRSVLQMTKEVVESALKVTEQRKKNILKKKESKDKTAMLHLGKLRRNKGLETALQYNSCMMMATTTGEKCRCRSFGLLFMDLEVRSPLGEPRKMRFPWLKTI